MLAIKYKKVKITVSFLKINKIVKIVSKSLLIFKKFIFLALCTFFVIYKI